MDETNVNELLNNLKDSLFDYRRISGARCDEGSSEQFDKMMIIINMLLIYHK